MLTIYGNTFSLIYKKLLYQIFNHYDSLIIVRLQKIRLCNNVYFLLYNPKSNLFVNKVRSPKLEYLYPLLLWYFSGHNDLQFISKYSKFWNKISDNNSINSAYGYLIFSQKLKDNQSLYEWAYESLYHDKYTRQAIIRFNKPLHSYYNNKDFVCTLTGIFNIRQNDNGEDCLNFNIIMRSQDMWFGIIYDVPFFTLLQQQMLLHLQKNIYPNLKLGKYTHYVISLHIYEKDFYMVNLMLKNNFTLDGLPLLKYNLIETSGKSNVLMLKLHIDLNSSLLNIIKHNEDDMFVENFIKYCVKK